MVIDDLSTPNLKNTVSVTNITNKGDGECVKQIASAKVSDRLLACFLDIVLHVPVLSLVVASLMYRLQILSWVTESESETFYVTMQMVFTTVLSILVLQTIYFKLLNFTPGMYFLKLRVKSFNHDKLTWGQCFLRSLFWIFGIALVGIPLVEAFSHSKKRLLHDRVSETEVVTLKFNQREEVPLPIESSMVRFFLLAIGFALVSWVFAFFQWNLKQIESGKLALTEFVDRGFLCEDVDEYAARSQNSIESSSARLDFAMSLFVLGQLDKKCLQLETDFVFLKKFENKNKYWARALLSAPNSENRKEYIEKACSENNFWCSGDILFTEMNTMPKSEVKSNLEKITKVNWIDAPLSFKSSLMVVMNRFGKNELVSNLISILQDNGIQSTGLIEEQLLIYQRENKTTELKSLLSGVKSVVTEKDMTRLYAQSCLQELNQSCQKTYNQCKIFNNYFSKNKEMASEPLIGRTIVKSQFCNPQHDLDGVYLSILDYQDLEKLFLIQQSIKLQEKSQQGALAQLRNYIKDDSINGELRWDALQTLLLSSNFEGDWLEAENFYIHWSPFSKSYLTGVDWLYRTSIQKNKKNMVSLLEKEGEKNLLGHPINEQNLGNNEENRLPASKEKEHSLKQGE